MDLRHRHIAALVIALGMALGLPAAQQDPARAEADLRAATERIQRLQQQVQRDEVEKNRRTRELRDAERSVAAEQTELTRLRVQRAERSAIRRHLQTEKAEREAEHDRTVQQLEQQLRAAYFMGRSEPVKLLLNQRSPAEFSRNLAYYGYLGRLRADQIRQIGENIAKIDQITASIEAEDTQLARLEQAQKDRVGELDKARRQRGQVLATLTREAGSRTAQLQRARQERAQLERTLERLRRELKDLPYDPDAPFAQARGRLSWPVAGRISVNYGATITGVGRSQGVEIDTDAGAAVRAIHEGRVSIADWHPGVGLLVILDHGSHWSLYGNLGELYVRPGSRVAAGETIGTAGDSGGRTRPGLHFEIRAVGKRDEMPAPVDPRAWFRTATPAPR